MKKKVLITGATGFIGSHAIIPLLNNDFEVHVAYIGPKGDDRPNLYWHECNLLDSQETGALMNQIQPTHLLHFAWYAIPGKYGSATENLHWTSASLSLIEHFVNAGGQRAVFSGTCAEYNWDQGLCSEKETPLEPNSLYGMTKASLYSILSTYVKIHNLSFAWGRIFFLYGDNESKARLVPSVVTNLLSDQDVKCTNCHQIRDFMHVQDIADAFTTLLDSNIQGAINIASGQPIALKELVKLISSKIESKGKPLFGALPTDPNDPPKIIADVSRMHSELDWQPKITLEQGIDETIAWWSNQLATV